MTLNTSSFLYMFSLCLTCLFGGLVSGQTGTLTGMVFEGETPLEYAQIALAETQIGTFSDSTGHFTLTKVPAGTYTFSIQMMGYFPFEQEVTVQAGTTTELEKLTLEMNSLSIAGVVVTGTMKETYIKDSPIKVDVISSKYLTRNLAPTNLVEGIALVNGVQEVTACGVCFTNSISINGLPGPYTAVLMDGAPMYGNLASVYGLNGIPIQIIDRFEVIKGPNSTLYGSEAVAGVINIITKNPKDQPLLSVDLMGTSHLESFGNITLAPKIGKFRGYVGVNYAYINDFEDENSDGFGDFISMDRISGFTKWTLDRKDKKVFSIAGKYYYEDRRNGVEDYIVDRGYRELRGSDSLYGESIYTKRAEMFGTYELPGSENFKLNWSLSHHDQDSYYGADAYEAKQAIAFGNFTWDKRIKQHDVLIGLTQRFQYYDDNTIGTGDTVNGILENRPDQQYIPGLFAQDEWDVTDRLTILAGGRLDHYHAHGPIFSPRLNVKVKPGEWTTVRMNLGTGFRIVNLFTEDHAFVTGQRTVEIREELNPERSYNASLNFNHIYTLGNSQGTFDIDAFYTHFTNKIIPNYDEVGKIIYENSSGHAVTKGIGMNVQHQFAFPLAINLGVNFQDVTQTEPDEAGTLVTTPIEFASRWSAVSTVNYDWKKLGLVFAYTLRITGPMALPEVFDLDPDGNPLGTSRPTESSPFAFQNLQVTKSFKRANFQVYSGIQNLFNYRQNYSPLVGYDDPNYSPGFSPYFDTAYAFSPIHGRELYFGFRWSPGGKRK